MLQSEFPRTNPARYTEKQALCRNPLQSRALYFSTEVFHWPAGHNYVLKRAYMDLQKLASDTADGVVTTLKFLRAYCRDSIRVLFRPSSFVRQFTANRDNRQRDSYLFLFTMILLLEVSLSVCNRVLDASKSADVGAGVLLYSGVIWELSWQALLKGTIPLYIALIAISWALAYLCGADSEERASFRDVYPYSLLRGTVLIAFSLSMLALLDVIVFFGVFWGSGRWAEMALFLLSRMSLALSVIAFFVFAIWRLTLFTHKLNASVGQVKARKYRSIFFSIGTVATLMLPIWWSILALEPPAAQVASSPKPTLSFDDQKKTVTLNIELRNFSGRPLNAIKEGSVLEWWDDEHPITESDFFFQERVPNGKLILKMPNDVPLSDGFKSLTFSGDLKAAALFPRSFTPYDFIGGPEADPAPSEVEVVRNSFEEIFRGYRKGRIEVRFEVVTEGGRSSYRSVVLPRAEFGP
jgi:hypothetical protein